MNTNSAHNRYQQQTGVVLRNVAGEYMLVPGITREIDMDSLFLLNAAGVWVWEQLAEPQSLAALRDNMAARFGIDAARAEADARTYLEQLLAQNLVVALPA
ncbi:MAG: PqqD family protein [Lentisphaerae bacterium]|jgi:hypothetical protein|nr:PqqD family protein [Lentisphaerota bacterium]